MSDQVADVSIDCFTRVLLHVFIQINKTYIKYPRCEHSSHEEAGNFLYSSGLSEGMLLADS